MHFDFKTYTAYFHCGKKCFLELGILSKNNFQDHEIFILSTDNDHWMKKMHLGYFHCSPLVKICFLELRTLSKNNF